MISIGEDEKNQQEKMIVLLVLGVLFALKKQKISDDEAQRLVFSPNLYFVMQRAKFCNQLVDIIKSGCELEDMKILSLNYEQALDDLITQYFDLIGNMSEVNPYLKRWYQDFI